jgi:hypothetical protein
MVATRKKRVAMTKQMKQNVFCACLVRVLNGILPFGSFRAVAADFEIHPKTVAHLWYTTMKQVPTYQAHAPIDPAAIVANLPASVFDTKFKNAGRKPTYDAEDVIQEIKNIDPSARRSIRSLAGALGIPRSTIGKMKQEKKLLVYSMSLKPKLNDGHL